MQMRLKAIGLSAALSAALAGLATQAQAGTAVVSGCSGVSLPPSVVTGIMKPVVTGVAAPLENGVNGVLGAVGNLPLIGTLPGTVNTNATGLLNQAASGQPITLSALTTSGTVVGPADTCVTTSDEITLNQEAGIAIGGNKITGLGANGAAATAGEVGSIALGNNASTAAGATNALALGTGASAANANSVALGAGSTANANLAAAAFRPGGAAVAGASASGEVSVGGAGSFRRLTNVAAGSADTDAANIGQLKAVDARVSAVETLGLRYDDATKTKATLGGAGGTTITNLRAGLVSAASTDAVNGAQLHATNEALAQLSKTAVEYDTDTNGNRTNSVSLQGGDTTKPVQVRNVARGQAGTDAANMDQLREVEASSRSYTDQQFSSVNAKIERVDARIDDVEDEARQAAAIGLAAASIRFDDRPGKVSMGVSGGVWRGESALAAGLGYTTETGKVRVNATASVAGGEVGAGAGMSFTFN